MTESEKKPREWWLDIVVREKDPMGEVYSVPEFDGLIHVIEYEAYQEREAFLLGRIEDLELQVCRLKTRIDEDYVQYIETKEERDYLSVDLDTLRAQVEVMREALEFYANNQGLSIDFKTNVFRSSDTDGKDFHGARARETLAKAHEMRKG